MVAMSGRTWYRKASAVYLLHPRDKHVGVGGKRRRGRFGSRIVTLSITITSDDDVPRTGKQYTFADAASGALRSWVFDSEGAIAQGEWVAKDDHWAVHWTITLPDGRRATAIEVMTPVDENTMQVKWSDIDVDGEMRPRSGMVTVRRIPDEDVLTKGNGNE
jgi:hypothetical protein